MIPRHGVVVAAVTAALALAPAAGCTDTTPYVLPAQPDAGLPDVGAPDASVDAGPTACDLCLRAPDAPGYGCADEMANCDANPACASTVRCAVDTGCLQRADLRDTVTCGTPCAVAAGITSQADPAISLIFLVLNCAASSCVAQCGPLSDGG